jgi:uracil-DNA glycosylase
VSNTLVEPIANVLDGAPAAWRPVIDAWRVSDAGRRLEAFLATRQAAGAAIYPATPLRALALTAPEQVRVVILGQDPYHGPGQAEGLAFSVPAGIPLPPSLRNIFLELGRDLAVPRPAHGHLGAWAAQGVLLLNTVLTVEAGSPAAHARQGWEALTDIILRQLDAEGTPKVFLLWGAHAQARFAPLACPTRHAVLRANHPSPLSARRSPAPFLGCGHFGQVNRFLEALGGPPIDWRVNAAGPSGGA